MAIETKHAGDNELQALLWADEDSADFRIAAAHVAWCETCQLRLEQLSGSHTAIDAETRDLLSSYPSNCSSISGNTLAPAASVAVSELDFLSPASHPELLGRLGRYEIERVIGRGGMGIVLKAYDTELNRPVAVKVLAKHLAHSGAARQRFARESRAAAAVVHEHVVAIHNVETEGDVPFLVMQFVAGESLQSRVDRDGPLDAREILRIGIQAAAGLAAAHEQGVIHRDVKPANILLETGVERVLLTDFGLARTVDDASLTQTGVIAGTPHYMSPEQCSGAVSDHRTDLFSLGSVMYFMATGHPPFRAERAMGVLHRICHDRQKSLWLMNNDLPDELSILVDRLLEKQASKRIHSADAAREQLVAMLAQIQQPRTGSLRNIRRAWMRYPRRIFAAVSLVAVSVIASLGMVFWPTAVNDANSSASPATLQEAVDTATSLARPVVAAQESVDFDRTFAELHERLDALNDFGGYSPDSETDDSEKPPTLQSLHQRLQQLQDNSSIESQLNETGK